jgi:hypothetical protein
VNGRRSSSKVHAERGWAARNAAAAAVVGIETIGIVGAALADAAVDDQQRHVNARGPEVAGHRLSEAALGGLRRRERRANASPFWGPKPITAQTGLSLIADLRSFAVGGA